VRGCGVYREERAPLGSRDTGDEVKGPSSGNELARVSGERLRLRGGWGLRKFAGSAAVDRFAEDETEVGVSGRVMEVVESPVGVLGVEAAPVGSAIYRNNEGTIIWVLERTECKIYPEWQESVSATRQLQSPRLRGIAHESATRALREKADKIQPQLLWSIMHVGQKGFTPS